MRLSKPVELDQISQVLSRAGCPICTFLRNEQAALLRGGIKAREVTGLCNFHSWALAAAISSKSAAEIFLNVLRQLDPAHPGPCSFCARIAKYEAELLKEMAVNLESGLVSNWMSHQGIFCGPHALQLKQFAPAGLHERIDGIQQRTQNEVREGLEQLLQRFETDKHSGSGILGRAAEFVSSQRGIGR